jgi:hypothetical protein
MIPAGNRVRIVKIWVKQVEDMPLGVRRSVDVKHRIRKRPVEGKSEFVS